MELARQGMDVEIREQVTAIFESGDPPTLVGVKDLDCDVAVFQRVFKRHPPAKPNGRTDGVSLDLLRAVKATGVRVVIDLDDDLGAIDPEHAGYPFLKDAGPVVMEACRMADLVTVSTPALAKRYGSAGNVVVIPNGVPRAYLGITRSEEHDRPVIGWTGSVLTHVGDLEQVGSSIHDLWKAGKCCFRAFGNAAELTLRQLHLADQEKQAPVDLVNLDYARAYANLDIAIVPLKPCRFSAAKSWLKMIEAAALGVPVVASASPENARLHEMGVGMLAERVKDWRVNLQALCVSEDMRLAMAAQGRAVASAWTIESRIAPMCWAAWTSVRSATVAK
jgi:glycosyltransferase involved in cell wall biosynthesis